MSRMAIGIGASTALGLCLAIYALYDSLLPFFLAFGLAYAFRPFVDFLQKLGIARGAAAVLLMSAVASGITLFFGLLIPGLAEDARQLSAVLPQYLNTALDRLGEWSGRLGLKVSLEPRHLIEWIRPLLEKISFSGLSPAAAFAGRLFSGAAGFVITLLNLVVMPVFFFYFLRDLPKIRCATIELVPSSASGRF